LSSSIEKLTGQNNALSNQNDLQLKEINYIKENIAKDSLEALIKSRKIKSNIEILGLKGKVKKIEQRSSSSGKMITSFNENGYIIEEISYDSKGMLQYKNTLKRNEEGNVIETNFHNSNGLDYTITSKYKYDDKGHTIERNNFISNVSIQYSVDEYLMILSIFENRNTYSYNENGNVVNEVGYDSSGIKINDNEYKFDGKGNMITRITANKLEVGKSTFKYDNNSLLIETNYYYSPEKLWILGSKEAFKYDIKGNIIEKTTTSDDYLIIESYNYNYDAKGNWVKQNINTNNVTYRDIERVIEYY
jgi:hypothetical protein